MADQDNPYRLEMVDISKQFPGVQALARVKLLVKPGEIHALVGENGAGKSTLMKILSGAYRRDEGSIFLDGKEVEIQDPVDALRLGIVTIYQESNLSANLSVAENVFSGRLPQRGPFVDWRTLYRKSEALLGELNINISPKTPVKKLSVAQCQMVEIAKALSISARVIVFDEPTAAITRSEAEVLFQVMRDLRGRGVSIVFITHRLAEVFTVADRVTVLRDGYWVATDEVPDLSEEKIILYMIGREVQHVYDRPETAQVRPMLRIEGLSGKGFENVSFEVQAGEIAGLFGLVGSGRTEVVRTLFGAEKAGAGAILLDGRQRKFDSPQDAIASGIVLAPEDRKSQGLILGMPIKNNISLPSLKILSRFGFIRFSDERRLAEEYKQALDIRCPSIATSARSLSGGNQQKVVLAKWLSKKPKVLIVDEPTRGIDVGAKAEVHRLMLELAAQGVAVLMVSSELPEVMGVSDRIYIMHEGRLVGEVNRGEANEEMIMTYASGQTTKANQVIDA